MFGVQLDRITQMIYCLKRSMFQFFIRIEFKNEYNSRLSDENCQIYKRKCDYNMNARPCKMIIYFQFIQELNLAVLLMKKRLL